MRNRTEGERLNQLIIAVEYLIRFNHFDNGHDGEPLVCANKDCRIATQHWLNARNGSW